MNHKHHGAMWMFFAALISAPLLYMMSGCGKFGPCVGGCGL